MKKTRLLALLMALVMVVTLFAACGDVEPEETTTEATTTEATTTEATTTEATTTEATTTEATTTETTTEVPGIDVTGKSYAFSVEDCGQYWVGGSNADSQKGQDFQAAIAAIEEKLGCTIDMSENWDAGGMEWIATQALSNTHVYDCVTGRQSTWIPAAVKGYTWAMDELAADYGLDLYNEEFCNQTSVGMATMDGHVWALDFTGRYFRTALGHFYAFNGDLTNAAGASSEQIYQAIRDFEWDYDMFLDLGSKITKDTDSDGQYDIWAVALDCDGNETCSNGSSTLAWDEANGKWMVNIQDPNLMPSLEFMKAISENDMQVPVYGDTIGRGDRRTNFYNGICGFAGLYGGNIAADSTGSCQFDLGVAPIPHGPNAQTYRMNIVDCDWIMILKTNPHIAETCYVINEIGYALTDYEGFVNDMLENLNYSEECMEVINNYLVPNGRMNIEKCSDNMYEITRYQFYADIYKLEKTPAQAIEAYLPLIQAELDLVFGY